MSDTYAKIKDIIVEILDVGEDQINETASFREDLGADSLDLVELIMAFEDEFGGRISDDEAREITTVGAAVEYVDKRMKAGA